MQIGENEAGAIDAYDRSGNPRRTSTQRFPKDRGCHCWVQFDDVNLLGTPTLLYGRFSARCAEIAHPVYKAIRGDEVAIPIL